MGMKAWLAAGAIGAAMLVAASPASATIYIGLQENGFNGGAITTVNSGATTASISALPYGTFDVNNVSGAVGVFPDLFNSNALDQISVSGTGILKVFITETGITNPLGSTVSLVSSLTSNTLTNGWTVTEATFLDPLNGIYGLATPLASQVFTGLGVSQQTTTANTGAGPYSVTEEFTINAPGAGSANATINIAAVPEPGTWLLMILGVFGIGALLRQQRSSRSLQALQA